MNIINPLNTIWTILHEFGHHISGRIDNSQRLANELTIFREEEAWRHAREFVREHKKLSNEIGQFEAFSKKCLNGYSSLLDRKNKSEVTKILK